MSCYGRWCHHASASARWRTITSSVIARRDLESCSTQWSARWTAVQSTDSAVHVPLHAHCSNYQLLNVFWWWRLQPFIYFPLWSRWSSHAFIRCRFNYCNALQGGPKNRTILTIWPILYSGELYSKKCIVKTSETLTVWRAFVTLLDPISQTQLKGCQTNC